MKISFNLRLRYSECEDCIKKIQELGGDGGIVAGDGGIVAGGSYYTGTGEQIDKLLTYMREKDYNMESMSINENPKEATQRRVDELKKIEVMSKKVTGMLNEKEKDETIKEALKVTSEILMRTFLVCELKAHIECDVVEERLGLKFKLKFELQD